MKSMLIFLMNDVSYSSAAPFANEPEAPWVTKYAVARLPPETLLTSTTFWASVRRCSPG